MIQYKIVFSLIVFTISLGPPLLLYHAKIKKYEINRQKSFAAIGGPFLSFFLAIAGINAAGFLHASFMKEGVPPLSGPFGDFFTDIYWLLAPLITFAYCRLAIGRVAKSKND